MADTQGNNSTSTPTPSVTPSPANSTLSNLQGGGNDIYQALISFANAVKSHPEVFGNSGKRAPSESQSNYAANKEKWTMSDDSPHKAKGYQSRGDLLDDFEQGIKDELLNSLAGGNFKKGIQGALNQFQKEFGFDLRNIGHEAGKRLAKMGVDAFKNSPMGDKLMGKAQSLADSALNKFVKNDATKESLKNVVQAFRNGGAGQGAGEALIKGGGKFAQVLQSQGAANVVQGAGTKVLASGGGKMMAGQLMSSGAGAMMSNPYTLIILAIVVVMAKVLKPALEGLGKVVMALGKSFNREEEVRKKRLEEAKKRLQADVNYITEEPFKILQQAVEKWTTVWDNNLRKIGQTQGYDKEAVYNLYESYADRLRAENLDSVIGATDIVDKLASVLDSGLTGKAAEEFAYAATKLNNAIPNQDFFSYVDTYASIAANAIAQGQSQDKALQTANQALNDFASNLLYSSRELAGGFTTGLKNGSSLFQQATQIAQTAKTSNINDISGTLTSVSAIIGAVAPDLADSLVSNVVQAAIGGNNETIVALRSLAGINAGNTDFLRAMAEDPKAIFSALFSNLANLQTMSPDNYMETAEGLAGIFGIDKAAFARVDFNYLASAINSMNTNNKSLEENMALLQSGQTTTSAEQLKLQEINNVITEQGLAYVIDSEAGRAIQQHMWDEQRAVTMMENEYAVNLQGSALEFLEGIRKAMTTLMNFLNPIGFISKGVANMTQTIAESMDNDQDIKEILKLGAVGSNAQSFSNLTTRGKDLSLTKSLVEMMGGTKGTALGNLLTGTTRLVSLSTGGSDTYNFLHDRNLIATNPIESNLMAAKLNETMDNLLKDSKRNTAIASRYDWGMVGKSVAQAIQSTPMNEKTLSSVAKASATNATKFAQEQSNKKFAEFLGTAEKAASEYKSYDEWVASAKNFGISDFQQALDDYGRSENELKSYFEANEARQGAIEEQKIRDEEKAFRDDTRAYWDYASGTGGAYYTAIWYPFFGEGQKYDTRMDAVDLALTTIQDRIGLTEKSTVIGGIEEVSRKLGDDGNFTVISVLEAIRKDVSTTFVSTSSNFQKCLADWMRYITSKTEVYNPGVSKASAWADLKAAEGESQKQASLALANALGAFTKGQIEGLDPQLQTNVLLGEIVVILQAIMQQNNTQAGGLSLIDTISALGLGATKK